MSTGKFFIPEFSDSNDKSAEIFRYRLLESSKTNPGTEIHPIYVTLKSSSIEFHFQGKIVSRDNGMPFIFGQVPLLTIPLGPGKDVTTEEIQKVFNRRIGVKWFMSPSSDSELYYLLVEPDQGIQKLSFSSLECFGLKGFRWPKKISGGRLPDEVKQKFLRRMLLDFLEDFFQNQVFRYSSNYLTIREKLYDVVLLEGIYLKANFYLKDREVTNDYKEGEDPDKLKTFMYLDALDKWTHYITRPGTKPFFANQKEVAEVDTWWNPKVEPRAWLDYTDVELMNALRHSRNFRKNPDQGVRSSQKALIRKRSVNFLIGEFEIIKAISITFSLNKEMLTRFIVSIYLFSAIIFLSFDLKGERSFINLRSLILPTVFLGSVTTIPFSYLQLGRIYLKSYLMTKYKGRIQVIFIRFISLMLNAIFLLFPILILGVWLIFWESNKLILSDWKWLIFYITAFLSFGLGCAVLSFIFSEAINIILPKLQMAVITSWIAILSPLDFWKVTFNISVHIAVRFAAFLILFTAAYLYFQIKKNSNIQNITKMLWKLVNVMVPSFLLSMSVGIIGLNLVAKKYITQNSFFMESSVRENIFNINEADFEKAYLTEQKEEIKKLINNEKILTQLLTISNSSGNISDTKNSIRKRIRLRQKQIYRINEKIDSIETLLKPTALFDSSYNYNLITYDSTLAYRDDSNNIFHLRSDKSAMKSKQKFSYNFILFKSFTVVIIPGFLLLMSSFALFSGIFLTLLFDDKPITEPL
jgi:hypothetical protein